MGPEPQPPSIRFVAPHAFLVLGLDVDPQLGTVCVTPRPPRGKYRTSVVAHLVVDANGRQHVYDLVFTPADGSVKLRTFRDQPIDGDDAPPEADDA